MSMLVCIRIILKTVVLVEHRGTTYCWALRGQHTKTISVGTRSVEHPELRIAKVHTKTRQRLTPQISKHVPFFTIPPQTFEIKRGRPLNWIASRFCVQGAAFEVRCLVSGRSSSITTHQKAPWRMEKTGKDLMLQTHWKNVTLRSN